MALTKIKTSNLETSIDLTGINDTATSQILTVSDTGIDVTGGVTCDGLTVAGGTTMTNGQTNMSNGYGLRWGDTAIYGSDATGAEYLRFDINSTMAQYIDSSGNVGIGVTPESWANGWKMLDIGNGGAFGSNSDSNARMVANGYYDGSWKHKNTDLSAMHSLSGGTHTFYVAPSGTADNAISWTTAMTIKNDGDVEMGTTSNSSSLNVYNDNGVKPGIVMRDIDSSPTYSNRFIRFQTNAGTEIGNIAAQGGSVAYITSSDYRLKENVVPMTGSIDRLKALNPSRFNFIADPDTTVDGFLAHEAQAVVPEAVSGDKDAMKDEEYEVTPAVKDENDNIVTEAVMGTREVPDMQGIDQAKLVPLLVGALQEQQTLIESLTTRLEALEGV